MILKIAWKNIWRSRTRSLVVIVALILGVWAVLFLSAFNAGMGKSYIERTIKNETSHIQIHHPKYKDDKEVKYSINESTAVLASIKSNAAVKAATLRTITNGMISSSRASRGVTIKGIDPSQESEVTELQSMLVEGSYFGGKIKSGVLVSKRMADKLKVKIRKKVTIRFQDDENNLIDVGLRIVGIFDSKNRAFDEGNVFVLKDVLNENLDMGNIAHEAAIILNEIDNTKPFQAELQAAHPELLVETYSQVAPEIELFNTQIKISSTIFTFIVMIGLIFSIINTMLMAVLERTRELGMLMAIGMNKVKIFGMIVIETLMLGMVGAPIGMLLGFLTINRLNSTGINLSKWSAAMQEFGIAEMVYPYVENSVYIELTAAIFITALLASLYPAFKAVRLKPVEAIRKI